MTEPLALTLTGAEVLRPKGVSEEPLGIAEGRIGGGGRDVDLNGYIVLPGIVDVHGDGFERHLAPRRGAMKDIAEGLVSAEAELAANGITTAVLAQFISWEGGLRGLDFADKALCAIRDVGPTLTTDLRAQVRFESNLLDLYDTLPDRMRTWAASYLVFNDHLPHDRLAAGRTPKRMVGQALKAGRSPEAHLALMQSLHDRRAEVPAALASLTEQLLRDGVTLGSHDDSTSAQRSGWSQMGVRIAEFPETVAALDAAGAGGDAVVMGAPNVVRGGSHNGNLSAIDAIVMGQCDALASDYHYPSPRRAALMLAATGVCDLARAWALISEGPAQVLGLADRGRIEDGLRADLVILDASTKRVAATIVAGHVSYLSGPIAARLAAA